MCNLKAHSKAITPRARPATALSCQSLHQGVARQQVNTDFKVLKGNMATAELIRAIRTVTAGDKTTLWGRLGELSALSGSTPVWCQHCACTSMLDCVNDGFVLYTIFSLSETYYAYLYTY